MAKKNMGALLWKLPEDTADEISGLQVGEGINASWFDAWLDEQSELTAYYATDLDTAVRVLEQELAKRGLSAKTH